MGKTKEKNAVELKHITAKVGRKIHKDLLKMLQEADDKRVYSYDINAHSDFCVDVVKMMDNMIGIVSEKLKRESHGKENSRGQEI